MSKFNKETLTFRDLIQAQLDGDTVQCFYGNSWIDRLVIKIDVDSLDDEVDKELYRIKPTKPSIDWSHVHPDYKCLVRNEDGRAILYKCKPELGRLGWYQHKEDCSNADSHKSYSPGNCHWTESLVERPKEISK